MSASSSPPLPAERRVLVVDDEVGVLRFLRETLVSLVPDCHVEATPNPEYAFELALKSRFDLFIFDLTMPQLDGALLYRLIRVVYESADPPIPPLPPMLLLTGAGDHPRVLEILREPGVRGVLAKPFTIERAVQKVSQCLLAVSSSFP